MSVSNARAAAKIWASVLRPLWLLVGLAACGAPSLRPTDLAAGAWWELRSEHFVLRTDLGRDDAMKRIVQLERVHRALAEVYELLFEGFAPPPWTTRVVLFASCDRFAAPRPGATGYAGGSVADGEPTVYLCGWSRDAPQTLIHELAHVFNSTFGPIPAWLQEGLATYLDTLSVKDGKVWVGALEMVINELPSLSRVLEADYAEFHGGGDELGFYIASRNLVGVLCSRSDEDLRRFVRYLHLLHDGASRSAAWAEAMAGLSMEKLEHDLVRVDTRHGAMLWWLEHRPSNLGAPSVERLRPGDAFAVALDSWLRRPAPPGLEDSVSAAERADPGWADGDFWRALILARAKNPDRPRVVALLRAHLAKNPGDERALVLLVRTREVMVVPRSSTDDLFAEDAGARAQLDTVASDALALARIARSARALNSVAWYFALVHKPEVGIGFARRSLEAEPLCGECKDTLALLLAEAGRFDEALAAEEEAMQLSVEDAGAERVSRLARYRALREGQAKGR